MNQSVSAMLAGGIVRVLQGFASAAPTFMVGLLIASILRYYLGDKGTRRLFGGDTIRSLPQSWLIGMLLPVCSIGVLPVLREMRRAGVKPGAMSAFALSAPLFNPLSLLYGLTLSRPLVIILFALGSLLIVTALGLFWDAFVGKSESVPYESPDANRPETDHLIGLRRLLAGFVHFAREVTGVSFGLALFALMGLAILAVILPFGAMQTSVERDDWMAPLTMLGVAIPVYATPMLAMGQLGMMFQHANSPGAAFTLLILGTGMNLVTPVWFARHFGFKSTALWFLTLVLIVIGISYGINQPLVPPGVEPAGHTHAFDIYANPISAQQNLRFESLRMLVQKDISISEVVAVAILAVMALVGLVFRGLRIDEARLVSTAKAGSFASSLSSENAPQRRGLDLVVPPGVIGATMLAGLVALSGVACFAYYPSPSECLEEVSVARAECLTAANSGNVEHALHWLPIWEDWSRRLEVGTFIRTGEVRPYQRMQGYLIRKKLELLEHELEHDPPVLKHTQEAVRQILSTNDRWVRAFRS
ncbi:MAG: permease [Planctomycetota bacterium]